MNSVKLGQLLCLDRLTESVLSSNKSLIKALRVDIVHSAPDRGIDMNHSGAWVAQTIYVVDR